MINFPKLSVIFIRIRTKFSKHAHKSDNYKKIR